MLQKTISVDPDHWDLWVAAADAAGLSVSAWLAECAAKRLKIKLTERRKAGRPKKDSK